MANIQTHYQSTTDGVTVVDPRFNHEDFVTKEANFQVNSESNSGTSSPRPMKVSKDGQTVLIPQPSNHSEDPLNWPQWKKNLVLISILPGAFFTDGIITYGITAFEFQAMAWHMTLPGVANSIAGAIFMQGPGGLLAVPLCQKFGRLPVLFWTQLLSLIVTIGASQATNYAGFTAARTLQGFFAAAPQVIGLSIIYDVFFFHERARKINIWAACFLAGPYLAPFISGFVIQKLNWENTFGVLAGFYGFSVLVIAFLGDETLYDRANPQPRRGGIVGRIMLLLGVTGVKESAQRASFWRFTKDLGLLIIRPYMLLPMIFIMINTMFTIGLVSTIEQFVLPPPYLFDLTQFSLLFLAPMIGTFLAEIWGHFFNNFLQNRYIRTHNGEHKPENRFWAVYPPWVLGIAGLVLFGQAIQHSLSWPAIAFGWGMLCFCTLGTTTAISAYILDVFPRQAAAAAAWILMARVIGGFSVNYYCAPWVARDGAAVVFGTEGGIIAAAIVVIIAMQIFGGKWRKMIPVPVAEEQ